LGFLKPAKLRFFEKTGQQKHLFWAGCFCPETASTPRLQQFRSSG